MNNTNHHITEEMEQLVADYLSQQIGPKETEQLWRWVSESDAHRARFLALQEIWFGTSAADDKAYSRFDCQKAYEDFAAKVAEERKRTAPFRLKHPSKKPSSTPKLWIILSRVAAAVLLMLGIAYGSFRYGEERLQNSFADIIIEAPQGSRIRFQLPDGSSVFLNSGSKAVYSQGFGVKDRRINLSGEGYFEVEHNRELPFTVKTDDIDVIVLGTRFNFSNYPEESEASVALLEGKVNLAKSSSEDKLCTLLPNESAVYDKTTGKVVVKKQNTQKTKAWIDGELYFDEERLDNIARILERSYNVRIRIPDEETAALRFYGSFGRTDMTLQQVLHTLVSTGKVEYSILDGTYVLSGNTRDHS